MTHWMRRLVRSYFLGLREDTESQDTAALVNAR